MERERQIPRDPQCAGDGGGGPDRGQVERVRSEADKLLEAADQILDSLRPVEAEEYLEQGLQRGGE